MAFQPLWRWAMRMLGASVLPRGSAARWSGIAGDEAESTAVPSASADPALIGVAAAPRRDLA